MSCGLASRSDQNHPSFNLFKQNMLRGKRKNPAENLNFSWFNGLSQTIQVKSPKGNGPKAAKKPLEVSIWFCSTLSKPSAGFAQEALFGAEFRAKCGIPGQEREFSGKK